MYVEKGRVSCSKDSNASHELRARLTNSPPIRFTNVTEMGLGELTVNIRRCMHRKTSLNRPTMGSSINGQFRGGVRFKELECHYNWIAWAIIWDPNKASDIGEWSISVEVVS